MKHYGSEVNWIDFQSYSGSPEKGFPHPLPQEHVDVPSIDSAEKVIKVWADDRGNDIGKYQVSSTE